VAAVILKSSSRVFSKHGVATAGRILSHHTADLHYQVYAS